MTAVYKRKTDTLTSDVPDARTAVSGRSSLRWLSGTKLTRPSHQLGPCSAALKRPHSGATICNVVTKTLDCDLRGISHVQQRGQLDARPNVAHRVPRRTRSRWQCHRDRLTQQTDLLYSVAGLQRHGLWRARSNAGTVDGQRAGCGQKAAVVARAAAVARAAVAVARGSDGRRTVLYCPVKPTMLEPLPPNWTAFTLCHLVWFSLSTSFQRFLHEPLLWPKLALVAISGHGIASSFFICTYIARAWRNFSSCAGVHGPLSSGDSTSWTVGAGFTSSNTGRNPPDVRKSLAVRDILLTTRAQRWWSGLAGGGTGTHTEATKFEE